MIATLRHAQARVGSVTGLLRRHRPVDDDVPPAPDRAS
jgi:hypothetical protein